MSKKHKCYLALASLSALFVPRAAHADMPSTAHCGRGSQGIMCADARRTNQSELWQSDFSDANGWNSHPSYYSTINFVDVNGDHFTDVCGRGGAGMYCALSTSTLTQGSFGPSVLWQGDYSDANGWNSSPAYYSTFKFVDVNVDGRVDLCGRGPAGIECSLSNGSNFGPSTVWLSNFSDANGWHTDPAYYSTIQFAHINSDNIPDICGRGGAGIYCALGTGSGFGTLNLWSANFSDTNGWNSDPAYYSTIKFADVTGDGRQDMCGRGGGGMLCGRSTGSKFENPVLWSSDFSDAAGWADPAYYSTIKFIQLHIADRKIDICGRGSAGILCGNSNGSSFGPLALRDGSFSDANGWNIGPEYYSTIEQFMFGSICARGGAGWYCGGSLYPGFSDDEGWNSDPSYYSTIQATAAAAAPDI